MKIKIQRNIIDVLILIGRFVVGALFFYSGFSKLIQPSEFFEIAIDFYDLLPRGYIHPVAIVVPWIEIIFGTYILLGFWIRESTVVLIFLTGIFQLVLAQALLRRLPIDECGCFGGGFVHLTLYQSFALDTLLILLLLRITLQERNIISLDNLFSRSPWNSR